MGCSNENSRTRWEAESEILGAAAGDQGDDRTGRTDLILETFNFGLGFRLGPIVHALSPILYDSKGRDGQG